MNEDKNLLQRLLAALGLPDDTTEDQLFALVEAIRGKAEQATAAQIPDPARFVLIEAVQELMTSRHADHWDRATVGRISPCHTCKGDVSDDRLRFQRRWVALALPRCTARQT